MVKLLSSEMLAFYNAVCPYMEDQEITFNNQEESPQFLQFLVVKSNIRDPNQYFCRDKLGAHLTQR